jgi:hypothetical protein
VGRGVGAGGGGAVAAAMQLLDLGFGRARQPSKGELDLCARAPILEEYAESTNLPLHAAYHAPSSRGVLVSASMADVSPSLLAHVVGLLYGERRTIPSGPF